MTTKTPFDRLLNEVSEQAAKEPLAAFGRLQECYNKSLTDADVQRLCSLAANLGGAGLGRWDDTTTFLSTLLDHPALEQGSATEGSIWRALAVMHRCARRPEEAQQAFNNGVRNESDHARTELMTAQMLTSRGRSAEAVGPLTACAELLDKVPANDEVRPQAAALAAGMTRMAEQALVQARALVLASSKVVVESTKVADDWNVKHQALYGQANASILGGLPRQALEIVAQLMEMEESNDAEAGHRFFTASLACRAQLLRGQLRVAAGALEACEDFAKRVENPELKEQAEVTLKNLRIEVMRVKGEEAKPAEG